MLLFFSLLPFDTNTYTSIHYPLSSPYDLSTYSVFCAFVLLHVTPHLVSLFPFLFPFYPLFDMKRYDMLRCLYDMLQLPGWSLFFFSLLLSSLLTRGFFYSTIQFYQLTFSERLNPHQHIFLYRHLLLPTLPIHPTFP